MLVVNRFRVADEDAFLARLDAAVEVLAGRPGFLDVRRARNLDEPDLWVLVSTWQDVGSYRRAIGSYDAKVAMAPLMDCLVHEPSAYEDQVAY